MEIDAHTADDILVQRLNEGEELAFDYFFHRYFPLILVFARHFIGQEPLAEEVVQDVFL